MNRCFQAELQLFINISEQGESISKEIGPKSVIQSQCCETDSGFVIRKHRITKVSRKIESINRVQGLNTLFHNEKL